MKIAKRLSVPIFVLIVSAASLAKGDTNPNTVTLQNNDLADLFVTVLDMNTPNPMTPPLWQGRLNQHDTHSVQAQTDSNGNSHLYWMAQQADVTSPQCGAKDVPGLGGMGSVPISTDNSTPCPPPPPSGSPTK
jgi:hypothetical protein